MRKFFTIIIIICILMSIVGCGKKTKQISDYKKKGKIIMGTNAQFPPFEYYKDENIVGFDIEIATKIAEKLEIELAVEDMNFDSLPSALEKEKIDFVLAGMTITNERKEKLNFSNSYYKSGQTIITMSNNEEINNKESLIGKKIGIQVGTTGEEEARKVDKATIFEYNTPLAAIMDLKSGNIDAVIYDLEPAKNFVSQNPDIKIVNNLLTEEEYAIAVRKEDVELLEFINEVIEEVKNDKELEKRYFDDSAVNSIIANTDTD